MFTTALANRVIQTQDTDLSPELLFLAQDAVMDCLGVGIAGVDEPVTKIARAWVRSQASIGQASLFGYKGETTVADAAFINAISAHALDFDDSHPNLRGHPSVTLVPTALAVGQSCRSSGRDVLVAYVIGLEVAGKLGRAFGEDHFLIGWHSTATIGLFASIAVAARLMGLSGPELQRAWGLGASQMSGLVRNFGTMTKPFHAGHTARNAIQTTWLVQHGLSADENIFDGHNNVIDTYSGSDVGNLEELLSHWARPWEIESPGIYFKGWPCCYSNHRAIGGLSRLIDQHGFTCEGVEEIRVGFLPGTDTALVSTNPKTALESKFSIEYVLSALLLDGQLGLATFTDAMVNRPTIRDLMKKVKREKIPDTKIYSGISGYTDLTVKTTRGIFQLRIEDVPGSIQWPLSAVDKKNKFIDCAQRILGVDQANTVFQVISKLQHVKDIGQLMQAIVPERERVEVINA